MTIYKDLTPEELRAKWTGDERLPDRALFAILAEYDRRVAACARPDTQTPDLEERVARLEYAIRHHYHAHDGGMTATATIPKRQ